MLVNQVNAVQLSQQQRQKLQNYINHILMTNPLVNIPMGGGWDNHCCGENGVPLQNGPNRQHLSVLKLIVLKQEDESVDNACTRRMKDLIQVAANRLLQNADVTLNNGEYTIVPTSNQRVATTFRFRCWNPIGQRCIRGPSALVIQFNAQRNGFAHVYPR